VKREVVECDRCGNAVGDSSIARATAGQVYAATLDGADRVGTSTTAADLCGGCLDELVVFMTGDEPPKPARRKP
jgi:hypothetical protein